ncbi:hypothetical protein [Ktedonobacter racemifer]|uniref:Uncharacterized protein n=1 Tax=Ktedonobacter racemifer DSM 44963 TaxID=485913 RepID=D6TRE3_KTERA|nr:hypothetical protein [Ktedonobacter racemifer]EFH87842.1 hypothetical protein Krac_9193 [Ktedonobacter racemifer DSM 44963]
MLIIGGLIVVAVLAVVGAFLLARGAGQETGATTPVPAPVAEQPATPAPAATPQQGTASVADAPTVYQDAQTGDLSASHPYPTPRAAYTDPATDFAGAQSGEYLNVSFPVFALRQEVHMLQAQVYQLSEHLQVLNQHAREIEQRLSHVHEMLPPGGQEEAANSALDSRNSFSEGHTY